MNYKLDVREKIALYLGILACIMTVALAVYIPVGPRKWYAQSQRDLASLQEQLQLQQLFYLDEVERLNKQKVLMEKLENRPGGFSLFTYVDNLLNSTGLRTGAQLEEYKPRDISPRQPMVQLRLQSVSFEQLVDFLHQVYGENNLIALYKLDYLRPSPTEKGLDCEITFVTLTLH
ncbi:MAG: hypothetical protein GX130_14120 [Candidatus Hydrogenedens sp.]|jgi:hypothetical protein|nr:hypothetical protein [Candidatus Hydrogenedens sp.]